MGLGSVELPGAPALAPFAGGGRSLASGSERPPRAGVLGQGTLTWGWSHGGVDSQGGAAGSWGSVRKGGPRGPPSRGRR